MGWCLTRSFFVQLFPRALVHLSLCIRHLPFPSAAHPPSQPVPCAQSPASRSCWLAENVTVVPPIAITPILFCRPHGPRTHTPFLFCCFVASQLVSLSSFAITSAPLLPFLPPTSCTHRRWFAPKDKMTTKTMKTTRECRRWTKMRCIHHSTHDRRASQSIAEHASCCSYCLFHCLVSLQHVHHPLVPPPPPSTATTAITVCTVCSMPATRLPPRPSSLSPYRRRRRPARPSVPQRPRPKPGAAPTPPRTPPCPPPRTPPNAASAGTGRAGS